MNSIKSLKKVLWQLNYILNNQQRRGGVRVLFCMIIASFLELLGVSSIYPFLQIMLNAGELRNKWYIAWLYNYYPALTDTQVLLLVGFIIIMVYLLKNGFMLVIAYVQNCYVAKIQREISVKMLEAYLKRPYQYFIDVNSSIVIRGIISDVSGVQQILINFLTMLTELLTVIVLGVFLLMTEWTIAISAMLLSGICFTIIIWGFKGRIKRAGQEVREAYALKYQYGYQAINGIKEITVLNRRNNFVRQYDKAAHLEEKAIVINGFISSCPDRILEGICIAGFMGIICIKIAMGTDLLTFVPVLGTFAMGAFRILPSISKISSRINSIIYFHPALVSTYDNIKATEVDCTDADSDGATSGRRDEDILFVEKLTIKKIGWKYRNTTENVLQNVSLYIRKGESVAFIGSSGAGKTTLADIIMGLLKPQSGEVKVDGTDIFTIPDQWCKMIGYVPQSVFLIDDTVRNNVAFGLEKDEISDDKVWAALEQAQLKAFVEKLPAGLDTIVGERGVKFSGGQRQRIAIARALYENPDILVLDEATSALDNETEHAVMESIDALQGVKTLIIVAHRLTTIRNCDRIYEIVAGIAIERKREEIFNE